MELALTTEGPPRRRVTHDAEGLSSSVTCVVPPLHGAMVVAHCIQVVDEVLRVSAQAVGAPPGGPVGGQTPAALASLDHVRGHVKASQGKADHVLKLHAPVSFLVKREKGGHHQPAPHQADPGAAPRLALAVEEAQGSPPHLSEALQVNDQHVRQRPEAQADASLLQLLAVGAAPGIVGGQLGAWAEAVRGATGALPWPYKPLLPSKAE